MSEDKSSQKPSRLIVGHSMRMQKDGQRVTFILIGQMLVFLLAMLHDEFTVYLVELHHVAPHNNGSAEFFIGVILFICWIMLTYALAREFTKPQSSD